MKSCIHFTACLLLTTVATGFTQPTFTSLHVFGDSASSTSYVPPAGLENFYYTNRHCNGQVWVDVLAGWRGLSFDITNHNSSYWEHYSPILVSDVDAYSPPVDVSTALFVVWVNNADMYWNITTPPLTYNDTALPVWTNNNNTWISNHFNVITNLYSKGVRTLLMPNAVDLTKTPDFAQGMNGAERAWVRLRIIEFNKGFGTMLSNTAASFPDLTIYAPDMFALFDDVLASPSSFGMTNPGVSALDDGSLLDKSLDGPGADYVSWDFIHPTAKFQMLFAEAAQELIWPVAIDSISAANGTNELDVINVPIGRDGEVLASTNLLTWTNVYSFPSTNTSQTVAVPASGVSQFYRLKFPFNWVWP